MMNKMMTVVVMTRAGLARERGIDQRLLPALRLTDGWAAGGYDWGS